MSKVADTSADTPKVSDFALSSKTIRVALVLLSAAAIAAYWFRQPIADFFTSIWDTACNAIIGTLGLGLVPVLMWVGLLVWAVATRRIAVRQYRAWLLSITLLIVVIGTLAFFQPIRGWAAFFTLAGNVSLGGKVGETIIGSSSWLGALRLVGILVLGVSLALPSIVSVFLTGALRIGIGGYLFTVVGVRAIAQKTRSMYRVDRDNNLDSSLAIANSDLDSLDSRPADDDYSPYSKRSSTIGGFSMVPLESSHGGDSTTQLLVETPRVDTIPSEPYSVEFTIEEDIAEISEPTNFKLTEPVAVEVDEDDDESIPNLEALVDASLAETPLQDDAFIEELLEDESEDDGDEDEEDESVEVYESDDDEETSPTLIESPAYQSEALEGFAEVINIDDFDDDEFGSASSGIVWKDPAKTQSRIENEFIPAPTKRQAITVSLLGQERPKWDKPALELLHERPEGGVTKEEIMETAETIKHTLSDYGVEVEIGQIRPGPTVTMYGLIPGWVRRFKQVKATDEDGNPIRDDSGKFVMVRQETKTRVKVDNILSREKDLALALKTPSIRIETPVMGKSQVGIEVPNPNASIVTLRSVMQSNEFNNLKPKAALPIALGKGSGGETVVIDLAKMPHLLIAGATGSGKSVCLNTIVSCLTIEKSPAELRLLLIDPKRVELTPFNGIPHLLAPVVVDTDKVVGLLKGIIREMLDRYRVMEEEGVRNIEAYNKRAAFKMPFLVVVIDELADLMMSAAFDVEQSICRLAQLGRATGIHLIVATQRPSVDVVTGLIKANFPSRISFGVTSQVDSRTILDSSGAEKLLGKGDMLYMPIDGSRPNRVQGVFISDDEAENLVDFWKSTPWAPVPPIDLRPPADEAADDDDDDQTGSGRDELFEKAIGLAQTHNKLSTSLLQRRLRIGYPRAARLMDELEDDGVVGPSDGSRSRDVIMSRG